MKPLRPQHRKRIGIGWVCLALLLFAGTASAWWDLGHNVLTRQAIHHLPPDLQPFFVRQEDTIAAYSAIEPPGKHYIDVDFYPEFFSGQFPDKLDVLIQRHGASVVDGKGTAPWTIIKYMEQLTVLMADARTERDWLDLLPVAGALAHYIEDLHNPMHLTLNYDGQLTGNKGLHARYEGHMVIRHIDEIETYPEPACCLWQPNFIHTLLERIDNGYWHLEVILAADNEAVTADPQYGERYYHILWKRTGALTRQQMADATRCVAQAWYTAWINAGSPALPPRSAEPVEAR